MKRFLHGNLHELCRSLDSITARNVSFLLLGPTMADTSLLLVVVTSFVFALAFKLITARRKSKKGYRLPPGPPAKPIVGNLLEIPKKHSWIKFHEWAKEYGPLYRLNLAGREHYVVSSEQLANKLLRERGRIYSSREQLVAGSQLLSHNMRPLLLPHNGRSSFCSKTQT